MTQIEEPDFGAPEPEPVKCTCAKADADDDDDWWPKERKPQEVPEATKRAVHKLKEKLNGGILTVWAVLLEDCYETSLGDGYYAFVEQVFLRPTEAAAAVELAEQTREDAGWYHWHIRRYTLRAWSSDGDIDLRPQLTYREPTTVEVLAEKLSAADLL